MTTENKSAQLTIVPPADQNESDTRMAMVTSRQAQEVQAAMVVAKKFPRDVNQAYTRIMTSCKRKQLAENAVYAYPRGATTVSGPSIRLAESLAQNWGNIDFGVIELDQHQGESTVMAYAWDLETNARQTKIFTVKHERHTRSGVTLLKDPRDIYELVANQGARRLRSCILGIIPGDITEAAVDECEKTMANTTGSKPLVDRVREMVSAFSEIGVSQAMIEARIGHKLEAMIEAELVNLRKVYKALKDGFSKREDYFSEVASSPEKTTPASVLTSTGKEPDKKSDKPADGAKSDPPKQDDPPADMAPDVSTPELINGHVKRLMERDGITDVQLVAFCKEHKMCGKTVVEPMQLREDTRKALVLNWDKNLPAVKEFAK